MVCTAILQKLGSSDPETLREAAFEAGENKCRKAVPLLGNLLQSSNPGVQEAAESALRKLGGPEAVQVNLPLLRSEEASLRNLAMDILRTIGEQDLPSLVTLLEDDDSDIRIFIADILGSTGSKQAVPHLCKALLHDKEINVRNQAAVSLGKLGDPEAASCLNKALPDEEWVQFAVIEALIQLRDQSSITPLLGAFDQASELVRPMIVEALGELGTLDTVPLLLGRLESVDPALRNLMVKSVVCLLERRKWEMSKRDQEIFRAALLEAVQDNDRQIQDAAVKGLSWLADEQGSGKILDLAGKLDPLADQDRLRFFEKALGSIGFTRALEAAVRSGSWKQGMVALHALGFIEDPRIAPLLMQIFWDKDRDMQREIMRILTEKADPGTASFFKEVLAGHKDGHVLRGAITFLGYRSKDPQSSTWLLPFLEHPYDDVKQTALEACAAIGDRHVITRFQEMAKSEDPLHRLMGVYGLGQAGGLRFWGELVQGLEDDVPDVRKIAMEVLFERCTDLERILPVVAGMAHDSDKDVRISFYEFLGRCASGEVDEYLYQGLNDPEDWVRIRAVEALGQKQAVEAVPYLIPMLSGPSPLVILKVLDALAGIGGVDTAEAVRTQMPYADPELQAAAELTLSRLQQHK